MRAGRQRVAALVALTAAFAGACACGSSGARHEPTAPTGSGAGTGTGTGTGSGEPGVEPEAAPEIPLEERIAAIEHAMNDLAPVASQCWAAAAADDLHVAGAVRMLVTVGRDASAKTTALAVLDEPGDPVLIRCLADVLAAYAWAPPVRGQAIELPFAFTAPAMQNVIDRRLVPHRAQAGVDVAVLLDELNTANPAASLLAVTIAPGARSGPRAIERTEVWVFRAPAQAVWAGGRDEPVLLEAGDALWVPAGARLLVEAVPSSPGGLPPMAAEAVVAIVPGGREGAARAGALPGATVAIAERTSARLPARLPAAAGTRYPRPGGAATIRLEPGAPVKTAGPQLSLLWLELDAGAAVPPHVHAGETEVLYILGGAGTMTVGGASLPVTEDSVIQIPPGVEHAFTASEGTSAIQLYTPAGPEQRFKGRLAASRRARCAARICARQGRAQPSSTRRVALRAPASIKKPPPK